MSANPIHEEDETLIQPSPIWYVWVALLTALAWAASALAWVAVGYAVPALCAWVVGTL